MHTNGSNTNRQLRRGSFADGQAHPELYLEARHVGTFAADGQASPELYPEGRHVGAFAEGQARPVNYVGEVHEGTFAERTATMGQTPSIDYRCARCGAPCIYRLVPLAARPTEDEVRAIPHQIPSIDLRCSRCGASQTYKLVPDSVVHPVSDRPKAATAA